MNAEEAKRLTIKSLNGPIKENLLKIAHTRIKEFALKGKYSVPHPFHGAYPHPANEAIEYVIHALRGEGYKAKHHKVDSDDPREYSYWEISW